MQQHPLHAQFEAAFNSRNPDRVVALYEPGAMLASTAGAPAVGLDEIREAYRGFFAANPTIRVETLAAYESSGGFALLHGRWELRDDHGIRTGRNTEVARKLPDGRWVFLIDNPNAPE